MHKYNNKVAFSGLAMAIGAVLGGPALAQDEDIEELVIVGQGLEETIPRDLSRYGNRVELITAEQIRERGYIDAAQALQMLVPGLHVRPKNGAFDYFDASLQGSRTSEILWLLDGVRITNRLYNGTLALDTIPAHMIERIEILKGGQGIFYGTQAVGGVVNIVTKGLRDQTDGSVTLGANTNDGYGVNAYYRAGSERHQFVVYGSKDESDGYVPYRDEDIQPSATDLDRGYDVNMVGFKYAFNPSEDSRLSFSYQNSDADLDFSRPYLNFETTNAREENIATLKYDWQASDDVGLFIKAYHHSWDTRYTRIYNTLDGAGNVTGVLDVINNASYWGYEDYGFNAMAKLNSGGAVEYVVGLDHQNFSGADDVWRIGNLEEEVDAVFVQFRTTPQAIENTAIAFGVRNNNPSNADDSTVWNFSAKHNITDNFFIGANVGTSFRLPDAEQLFLNEYYDDNMDGIPDGGWFAVGNPNLKPEKSENVNVSLGGSAGGFSYEVIAFTRDITDYIDSYVPLTIGGVVGESFVNSSDEVNVDGFELIGSFALSSSWSTTFSYLSTDSEQNSDGVQITTIPESEIKFSANYDADNGPFGFSIAFDRVGDINARQGVRRGDYTVVDLSGYYNLGRDEEHQLVLRIENLTDEVYSGRVYSGPLDTGGTYQYDALGMKRTIHASYTRRF